MVNDADVMFDDNGIHLNICNRCGSEHYGLTKRCGSCSKDINMNMKRDYVQGNKCSICNVPITRKAKLCKKCCKTGDKNAMWKSDSNELKYWEKHYRVKLLKKKPKMCEYCKNIDKLDLAFKYHNANKNTYTTNPKDYV